MSRKTLVCSSKVWGAAFSAIAGVGLLCVAPRPAQAGTFSPVAVSGYDTDIIFENATPSTTSGKFGSRNFAEQGFTTPSIPAFVGLNSTGVYSVTFGGDNLTFDLEPYTANNIAKIAYSTTAATSATLTLATPTAYQRLALAYGNASLTNNRNASTFDAIVTYSDATTATFPLTQIDWGITTPAAAPNFDVFNVSRINSSDGTLDAGDSANATDVAVRWGAFGIILDVDDSKFVSSITLSAGTAGATGGEAAFFALSALEVPEPCGFLLAGAALVAVGMRWRWHRRPIAG